jgi:hypothetical protein
LAWPLSVNLRWIKTGGGKPSILDGMSGPFVFQCPATSQHVQGYLDDDDNAREDEYEAVACPACARLHFFNRKTGKMLGHESE